MRGGGTGKRRADVAVLAVLTILVAGCGGISPTSGPVPAVQSYVAALANNDGSTLCSLLTGEAKERIARGAAVLSALTRHPTGPSCPGTVSIAHEILGADRIAELHHAKVTLVSQSSSTASVRVTLPDGHTGEAAVANTAAGWLINTAPANLLRRDASARASSSSTSTTTTPTGGLYADETRAEYEQQLAKGEIAEAVFNKRIRSLHMVLKDGRHVRFLYPAHTFVEIDAALQAKGVPVTVLTAAEARAY